MTKTTMVLFDVVIVLLLASQIQSVRSKRRVQPRSSSSSVQGDDSVFQYCYCNKFATVGMQCNPSTPYEDCKCLPNFTGGRCERCMPGYFNFPNCLPCKCNPEGSTNLVCDQKTGKCPCKVRIRGMKCDLCPLSHFGFPQCKACECNQYGTYSAYPYCDDKTGQCKCKRGVYGRRCNQCPPGYYNFPQCWWCNCNMKTTTKDICTETGKCICKDNYQGNACDECSKGYYSYPQCTECDCKSGFGKCGKSGECICFKGYSGRSCDKCAQGYYGFPSCAECDCDPRGSHNNQTCHQTTGKCQCKINVVGRKCDGCAKGLVGFPACRPCTCNPAGTKPRPGGGLTCFGFEEMRCLCKPNVEGKTCDRCRYGYYNFSASNPGTCSRCVCSIRGSLPGVVGCDFKSGTCSCKTYATGAKCETCIKGTYGLRSRDYFGCKDCKCNRGGSIHGVCDEKSGRCKCHPGVIGSFCDRIQSSAKVYFPTLHHIKAELEDAVGSDGIPVLAGSDFNLFPMFSGSGYVVPPIYMPFSVDIEVPVSGFYHILINYAYKEKAQTKVDITLKPKGSQYNTYRISDTFNPTHFKGSPRARLTAFTENGKNKEVKLTKGFWTVSFTCRSTLFLIDYIVLLPEDYYTGSALKHTSVEPCEAFANYNKFCSMFKYFSKQGSHTVHGIHGFIDSGLPVIKYIEPKFTLKRLEFGNSITLLGKYQPRINYEIQEQNAGLYIIVVKYIQPNRLTQRIEVKLDNHKGKVAFLPCGYRFGCQQVITDIKGGPMKFNLKGNLFRNKVSFIASSKANIGIISLTVFEEAKWNISHVTPSFYCFFHHYKCVKTLYSTPRGSATLVEQNRPSYNRKMVIMNGIVESQGKYHIIIHYKLTSYMESKGQIQLIPDKSAKLTIEVKLLYCAAVDGCRSKVDTGKPLAFRKGVSSVILQFPREVQIQNVVLVPENSFSTDVLKPYPGHLIDEFLQKCSKQNFYINPSGRPHQTCMRSIFTMTLALIGKPSKCDCDPRGSASLNCKPFGGQCMCRSYVVGRRCDRCPVGYSGFPLCRKCSCSVVGSASQDCDITGKCTCSPGFGGFKCDRCQSSFYYGFPQCKKCNCHNQGSLSRFCSRKIGQCQCRINFDGKKCDRCRIGYFNFPTCKECNCVAAGILVLPGQENTCGRAKDKSCTCKVNVQGTKCEECKDLFFGLSIFDPAGCQPCKCNSKGTLGTIATCKKSFGDCLCKKHVTGRGCSTCKSGYFNMEEWNIFGCTKCACNAGGSFGSYCDAQSGQCLCLPGIEGRICDRVIPHSFYFTDLHHIKIELEDATNEQNRPVVVRDDSRLFPGFTWKGYTELNTYQSRIHLTTNIPRTGSYRLIFHYSLNDRNPVDALLKFEPTPLSGYLPEGRPKPFQVGVRFKPTATWQNNNPQLLTVLNGRNLPIEVVLSQGKWKMSLAARPSYIYLDHLVLLPEAYYNPSVIGKEITEHCQVATPGYCREYKYPPMDTFISIQSEKSLLTGPAFTFVNPPFKGVTLNGYQNSLTLQLSRDRVAGTYVVIVTFYYEDSPSLGTVDIVWRTPSQTQRGFFSIFKCRFTNGCRQVAIDSNKRVAIFQAAKDRATTITLTTNFIVAVDFITVIPQNKWNETYLLPAPYCTKLKQSCIPSKFTVPATAVVIQAENNTHTIKNGHDSPRPPYIQDPNMKLAHINIGKRTIYINAHVTPDSYLIVVHYFQPDFLSFSGNVILSHSADAVASRVDFRYCPHVMGCRSTGMSKDRFSSQNRIFINFETDVLLTVTIPEDKAVWIDSILLVPTNSFLTSLLEEQPVNMTSEFINKCATNHFLVKPSAPKLCLDNVFTLTTRFNRGGLPCECDKSGSIGIYCETYGGQCQCKPNVIGRTCNTCKAGYTGFPNCRRR